MVGKATSKGQKVNLGKDAPSYQEGTGTVASDSLAAESYREGGEFASNRNAAPHESTTRGTESTSSGGHSSGGIPSSEQGQAAPTYVNNQYVRDQAGPHGKNLEEGGFAGSGPGNSIEAEPGSKHDPARLAEQKMNLNQTHGGTGTGPRQVGVSGEQPYGALDSETSS